MKDIDPIEIRLAEETDKFEICSLLKNLGLNIPDSEEGIIALWNKLWNQNPYFEYIQSPITYGWVMVHNNKIVGFFGSIPRLYLFHNQIIPVAIAGLWGVDKAFRSHTNLLCAKFFLENPVDLKLVTTAIKPTGRIFKKYNGHQVPMSKLNQVLVKPIDFKNLLLLRLKAYPKLHSFIKVFGNIFNLLNLPLRLTKRNNHIREISINHLPTDIPDFLKKASDYHQGLLALRTDSILKWFYQSKAKKYDFRIFIYTKENCTLGLMVLLSETIKNTEELKRFKIIDIIASNSEVRKSLIKESYKIACQDKIDLVEFHLAGMVPKKDIPGIILKRKYPHFPLYFQTNDYQLNLELQDGNLWNIMPFDGDTVLG